MLENTTQFESATLKMFLIKDINDCLKCRSRIDQLFEKQAKVTQMKDFWFFVEGDLMDGLYWEKLYNQGRKTTEFR